MRQSDLGPTSVWTGGVTKPDLNSQPLCADYHPDRSGLVITGAAASSFADRSIGLRVSSETEVFRTAAMVAGDWNRSVRSGAALGCEGDALAPSAGSDARVVSAQQLTFPGIGALTATYRYLVVVGSGATVGRYLVDVVFARTGRAVVTLTTIEFISLTKPTPELQTIVEHASTATETQLVRALIARLAAAHPLTASAA